MKASVIALLLTGLVAAQDFTGQPDCAVSRTPDEMDTSSADKLLVQH